MKRPASLEREAGLFPVWLEVKAERHLHVPHVVRLTRDFAEGRVGGVERRTTQIRVIENVERLRAELQPGPFRDRKLLVETKVEVLEAGIVYGVPDAVLRNERTLGRLGKDRRTIGILGLEPRIRIVIA